MAARFLLVIIGIGIYKMMGPKKAVENQICDMCLLSSEVCKYDQICAIADSLKEWKCFYK